MKELKTTNVTVNLEGEKVELNVKHNIPFSRQKELARIYAQSVVSDEGVYEPWLEKIYRAFTVLFGYAGFILPTNWTDDDVAEFVETNDYADILNAIDVEELCYIYEMAAALIEYRKQTCRRNGFIEAIDNIKSLFTIVNKAYQESPEMAELPVEGLMKKFLGVDNSTDSEFDDDVEFEVLMTDDEVKEDANL